MPSSIVRKYAKETGKSIEDIEKKWKEAKEAVLKSTRVSSPKFYPEVVTVLKRMLHLKEDAPVGNAPATTTSDVATYKDYFGTQFRRPLIKKKKKKIEEDALAGAGTGGGNITGSIYASPVDMDSKIGTSSKKMGKNNVPMYANDKLYRYNKKKKKKIEERITDYLRDKNV
jgi:hypothetical protein